MGDRRQELEASVELILTLAREHAGELAPDVEYAAGLVLAAPELLIACTRLLTVAVKYHLDDPVCNDGWNAARYARAIIAKAERGEQ